jgi:hypothetical protein
MFVQRYFNALFVRSVQAVLSKVGFWCEKPLSFQYSIDGISWSATEAPESNKWLVILGRKYYFETVKDYPIGYLKDLKSLLKNESLALPYDGPLFRKFERLSAQSYRVTTWVIKPEVLDELAERPLWIIPESACVERVARRIPIALDRLGQTLYVSVTADGLQSSQGQGAAFLSHVQGRSEDSQLQNADSISRFSEVDTAQLLVRGLVDIFKVAPFRFFLAFDIKKMASYPWVEARKLSIAFGLAYGLLSSLYLVSAHAWLDFRLQALSLESESALQVRREMAIFESRANSMNEALSNHQPFWVAWDVMLDLVDEGVTFRAINSADASVSFYITVSKATDVLSWLDRDPRVASAKFSRSVRKVGDAEQVSIEVTFPRLDSLLLTQLSGISAREEAGAKQATNTGTTELMGTQQDG